MSEVPGAELEQPVAIIGGGLAGLAAAVGLASQGIRAELFEARRQLGGRAASFRDPVTDELIDYCQHVSMGCCTNLADFCQRTGIADEFDRHRVLHFFTADGRRYDLAASRWLPAPLHMMRALLRLNYLSIAERMSIAGTMWRLARLPADIDEPAGDWFRVHGQSDRAIEQFWSVVLTSALGESLDRASIRSARHVFADAFLADRTACDVLIPRRPLSELFDQRVADWLGNRGAAIHRARTVEQVHVANGRVQHILLDDGARVDVSGAVIAVPWRRASQLFDSTLLDGPLGALRAAETIEGSPITGVHLWFDRPITSLEHAVLVGMLSQWMFNRGAQHATEHYYQVVISASRALQTMARTEIVAKVVDELKRIWPEAAEARIVQARVVTDPAAVFSPAPGVDRLRPRQATPIANLAVAGDWTDTAWPATMEGAVRSGYAAAEAILADKGFKARLLVPDLPRPALARWLGL
jgi:squalene-associated FAD-dependent desaturase